RKAGSKESRKKTETSLGEGKPESQDQFEWSFDLSSPGFLVSFLPLLLASISLPVFLTSCLPKRLHLCPSVCICGSISSSFASDTEGEDAHVLEFEAEVHRLAGQRGQVAVALPRDDRVGVVDGQRIAVVEAEALV